MSLRVKVSVNGEASKDLRSKSIKRPETVVFVCLIVHKSHTCVCVCEWVLVCEFVCETRMCLGFRNVSDSLALSACGVVNALVVCCKGSCPLCLFLLPGPGTARSPSVTIVRPSNVATCTLLRSRNFHPCSVCRWTAIQQITQTASESGRSDPGDRLKGGTS